MRRGSAEQLRMLADQVDFLDASVFGVFGVVGGFCCVDKSSSRCRAVATPL